MNTINGVLEEAGARSRRVSQQARGDAWTKSIACGAMPRRSSSPGSSPRRGSWKTALQELRSRGALSGSDFLPLAVKLDQLYGQFALLRSLTSQAGPAAEPDAAAPEARMTENGTQIIEAPKFLAEMAQKSAASAPPQSRPRHIAWRRRAASTAR